MDLWLQNNSNFQQSGLKQVFTPPDPNDLSTSTQILFTGVITYMTSTSMTSLESVIWGD